MYGPSERSHNPTAASMASRKFTDIACRPCPGGTIETSPAFQRRDSSERAPSPVRTAEIDCVSRPSATYPSRTSNPALKRRAIILCPSGTETARVTSNPSGIGLSCSQFAKPPRATELESSVNPQAGKPALLAVAYAERPAEGSQPSRPSSGWRVGRDVLHRADSSWRPVQALIT